MDVTEIVREIDERIETLKRVRELLSGDLPVRKQKRKVQQRKRAKTTPRLVAPTPEPVLVKLPPKVKREYSPRVKPVVQAPLALASAPYDKPIFVPKSVSTDPIGLPSTPIEIEPKLLEETVRQNLFSGFTAPSGPYRR